MAKKKRELQALVGLTFLGLAVLALFGWAIWLFFKSYISPDWTRMLAIVGLVSLPVVGWVCYNLGLTEARGKLGGIDAGIDKVVRAASAAIDLRATSAKVMREASRPPEVALPQIPTTIITRGRLTDGEVVEI